MRLRLQAERIARLCGIAGVLLVSGAGAAEAARWAFPAGARAAAVVYQDQPTPDPAATTAAAPPADPVATAESADIPAADPTVTEAPTNTETPAATEAPTNTETPAATEAPTNTEMPTEAPTQAPATAVPAATAAPPEAPTEPPATTLPTATTAPTEAPTQLSASAVPTAAAGGPPAIGEAPLRLSKSASVARAVPGQTFSYAIELLSSHAGAVELHDYIDPLLEVIAVEAPGASCAAGNPVVCTVHMESSRPAAIVVRVRTRQSAAPGTPTVSQALAQDERSFTASSDPVVVQIAPLALPVLAQAGTPTPIVTEEEEEEPIPTETATPAMTAPAASPTPLVSEEAPAASLTPLISEEGGTPPPAAQQPQPTPTPTTSPIRPPTRPAQAVVPLPTTSATVPAAGLGVGLIGFALILHGARRVRHQNAALAGQVATFRPLHALGRTIASLQRATAVTTAEMNARVRQLAELLERRIED